jgi:uncharacterized protein GlcG (DUF336 family)
MPQPDVHEAVSLVQAVLAAAADQPVAVVVVDTSGQVVASARTAGLNAVATGFAQRKALASATFGAPTQQLNEAFGQDPLLATEFAGSPEVCLLPGGFPVLAAGACVGGLGVSGGHYSLDHTIGEKALAQ